MSARGAAVSAGAGGGGVATLAAAGGGTDTGAGSADTTAGGDAGAAVAAAAGLAAALAGTATEPVSALALTFAGAVVEQAPTHTNSSVAAAAAAQVPRVRAAGIYCPTVIEIPIDIKMLIATRAPATVYLKISPTIILASPCASHQSNPSFITSPQSEESHRARGGTVDVRRRYRMSALDVAYCVSGDSVAALSVALPGFAWFKPAARPAPRSCAATPEHRIRSWSPL